MTTSAATGRETGAGSDARTVLVTGAAGRVGGYLRRGLPTRGWQVRALDMRAVPDDPNAIVTDIRDTDAVEHALRDVDAIVHLAARSTEGTVAEIVPANLEGTWSVFEAARRAGVKRVVYGSSNHAVGFVRRSERLGVDVALRPDTNYGVSKAFGEVLARFYVDRHDMEVACVRIGSCDDRPRSRRMLSTWLSPGDSVRLFDACLRAPDLGHAVVYGISANTRAWWDLEPARKLGYEPRDDAEVFASELLKANGTADANDPEEAFVGGAWTTFSPDDPAGSLAPMPPMEAARSAHAE